MLRRTASQPMAAARGIMASNLEATGCGYTAIV